VIPRSTAADDKKIQMAVKKIGVNAIPGIEEVRPATKPVILVLFHSRFNSYRRTKITIVPLGAIFL